MESSHIIKRAKKGDKEALVHLIMSQKAEYYKLAYAYTGNKDDALDALEDMIVILYDKISSLKKDESFYSWSKTILANCCKKILKNKKKIIFMDTLTEQVYEESYGVKEQRIDIQNYLQHLNSDQQEVIKLKYFLDFDYKTIAEITKVSEGTAKSRVFNGLRKLKEIIGGEYYEKD